MKKTLAILALSICMLGSTVYATDYEALEVGSNGGEVQQLQQALIEQGFLTGAADGIFGNGTAEGVKKFQESMSLEVTGVADEETQRLLYGDEDVSDIEINLTGITETDYMRVDGIFADESYVDEDNESLTMFYFCYTAFTDNENLKVDSKDSEIAFNGVNTYTTEHYPAACTYMGSYLYSNYLKDVYVGEERKIVETMVLPKGELAPGRTITFKSSQIPDSEKISLVTDDIIFCKNSKTIAKIVDPEGYADIAYKMEVADAETTAKVKEQVNGYRWNFFVNNISYIIDFYDSTYELTTALGTTDGSYTVRNGYITLVNSFTGAVSNAPYTWENGVLDLDICAAFDVSEN